MASEIVAKSDVERNGKSPRIRNQVRTVEQLREEAATPRVRQRFSQKYAIVDSGCWEWKGGSSRYAQFFIGDRMRDAHRISYLMHVGLIPDGLFVLHRCDNTRCVNPEHLFLGTQGDNIRDCVKKGRRVSNPPYGDRNGAYTKPHRMPRGESHGMSKFTTADVLEIRRLHREGMGIRPLARKYKVNRWAIDQIIRRLTWAHVA